MRRLQVAAVLIVIVGIVEFVHFGPPRFWADFTGMSEATAREKLGEPLYDSRGNKEDEPVEYTLGWYQGFEVSLFLTFRDGVVVSQKRMSR